MNEEMKEEIVKAYAYGYTDIEVAQICCIQIEEAKDVKEECAERIVNKREDLRKAGMLE